VILLCFLSYVIFNISSLNLNGYNSKKVDSTYADVSLLFNLEQIPRGWKQDLGIQGLRRGISKI